MIITVAPVLLWLAFAMIRARIDAYKEKDGEKIIHWLNFAGALIFCGALIGIFHIFEPPRLVGFLIWAGCYYSFLFNRLYNYWAGNPPWHLGTNFFDRIEDRIGYIIATRFKLFFGVICLAGYFVS